MDASALYGQRIVVTGGAGFIGCHSVEALQQAGASVLILDDLRHSSKRHLPGGAELAEVDAGTDAARRAIERFRPNAILHLAAQGGVNRSWRDPAADAVNNVLATVNVAQAALSSGCRLVFASSGGALYGDAESLPTPEDAPRAPRSPYGCAKASCEVYLEMFSRSPGGLSALALRYSNVYGPGQDGTGEAGVVAISSERLVRGQPPVVRGDGMQTRDFVFVEDVADANLRALCSDVTGALNVGTGRQTPVRTVVEELAHLAGFAGMLIEEPAPGGEVRRSALDAHMALEQLGWSARTDLLAGLRRTYEHFLVTSGAEGAVDRQTKAGQVHSRG